MGVADTRFAREETLLVRDSDVKRDRTFQTQTKTETSF